MSDAPPPRSGPPPAAAPRASWRGHLRIARVDHWFKNVFVLPGVVAAAGMAPAASPGGLARRLVVGLASTCLIASSNYVINEVMDAACDRHHPTKCARPVPSGQVSVPVAYVQWIALMMAGLAVALSVSRPFATTLAVLWIMGGVYNLPPVRTKDVPYVDVLSEAVNNPLRLLAGWFIAGADTMAPASLLLSYWMIGAYFMAMKRFAEYREIRASGRAAAYRRSFGFYDERRLLVSIMFYGAASMLFFGAFIMRYRLELIVSFPLVALIMAIYLSMAFDRDSPVQQPERLYRHRRLMVAVVGCTVLMTTLLFVDLPALYPLFAPTAPVSQASRWSDWYR